MCRVVHLVNGLIYHVRKVNTAAREYMEQQVLALQWEGNESCERIGQILSMFIDDSIDDSVSFGEVKQRAFGMEGNRSWSFRSKPGQ